MAATVLTGFLAFLLWWLAALEGLLCPAQLREEGTAKVSLPLPIDTAPPSPPPVLGWLVPCFL